MSSNNGGTPPSLEGITSQLQAALEAVRDREADARLVLTGIEGERKKLEKMIELATATGRTPAKKHHRTGSTGSRPEKVAAFRSEAKLKLVEVALMGDPVIDDVEHSFTIRSLREGGLPNSEETIRRSITDLRDEGRVRLVGTRRLGSTGKGSVVYALVNAQDERETALAGSDVSSDG